MSGFFRAFASSMVAALCALLAVFLAWNHPLAPAPALLICAALALFTFMAPARWVYGVFPALPVAGLMTWTGWMVVEELDLLILAVAAGGYTRLALGHARGSGIGARLPNTWRWLLPIVAITLLALWRGVQDAGGDSFGWWQGYREPGNSLRLAKGLFEALLLLPLMRMAWQEDPVKASARLVVALTWMLLVTAAAVVWERLAFTSLLDFSTDYRATGLFWEMHVGGAALDAVLVIGMPFAAAAWYQAKSMRTVAVPVLALGLGAYACAVTFSRIVYVAVPLSLGLWWWLRSGGLQELRRSRRASVRRGIASFVTSAMPDDASPGNPAALDRSVSGAWSGLGWLLGFSALAWWLFPGAGWRGMLAMLGAATLMLPLQALHSRIDAADLVKAWAAGVLLGLVVAAMAWLLPKGAYLGYGLAWCAALALLGWVWVAGTPLAALGALACTVAVLAGIPAVAWQWGGLGALWPAAAVALLLILVLVVSVMRPRASWPDDLRWQSGLLGGLAMAALLAGVFGGGAYMADRLGSLAQDSADRQLHWKQSLGLLRNAEDWTLGKGLGRYPAQLALSGRPQDQTGDLRLAPADPAADATGEAKAGHVLALTSGLHPMGSGALFRLSQRVQAPQPDANGRAATLRLEVRNPQPVSLVAEVCAKNLLYAWGCASAYRELPATASGAWQTLELPLVGPAPKAGRWWAPRPVSFSLAIDSPGRRIEIDRLSLIDGSGLELLGNGSFEQGLAYWYPSSDRHHLPWHAKNAAVHLLVEQGVLGLLAWLLAGVVALWRLSVGRARNRSLAPALAAALVGLAVVGVADSLFDLPRVAFLGTWLLVLALALPGGRRKKLRARSSAQTSGRKRRSWGGQAADNTQNDADETVWGDSVLGDSQQFDSMLDDSMQGFDRSRMPTVPSPRA